MPEFKAKELTKELLAKKLEGALRKLRLPPGKVYDESRSLLKGFQRVEVHEIVRARKPQKDWFSCPGYEDFHPEERGAG